MSQALKPYPEYEDSGLPWLGEVPEHWEVRRNGRIFAQRIETGFPDLPILEVSLKTGIRVRNLENSDRKQIMSSRGQYKRAAQKDIAYNMMRMWQGAVGVAPVDGLVSPAYVVARPFPETESRYYSYLFRTVSYMNEVNKYSHGIVADRNRLYWDEFKQMPSTFPPQKEQQKIADFLDVNGSMVRHFIRAKQKLIKLLEEQKQVIIHHAVTRGLDPNVRLKPSGVEWLGDVSEHWEIWRIFSVFRERNEKGQPDLPILAVSIDHGVTKGEEIDENGRPKRLIEDRALYKVSRKGDIAYNMMRMWQGAVGVVPEDGLVSPAYVVARPREYVHAAYFAYLFRTEACKGDIVCRSRGIVDDRNRLYWGGFKDIHIPFPPHDEQNNIINFIEEKTDSVEQSVEKIKHEIVLLREYRTRLISDVVTGKLDVRGIELPAADAEAPEECSDLPDIETALEDQEMEEEIPAEGD